MLESLAGVVEGLGVPVDGDAIVQVLALRDRLDARIAEAVGAFDAAKLWDIDGATSMTAWLRSSADMTKTSAGWLTLLGRRMRQLPVCAAAYGDGSLSGGQMAAILANVDDSTVEVFAGQEAEVVPYLVPLTVAGTARAMAGWKARAKVEAELPAEPERSLHLSRTLDDRYVLDGSFDSEGGATVEAALRLASPRKMEEEPNERRIPSAVRADALVTVCRHFLDNQKSRSGGRHRPHLNVVVDLDALHDGAGGRVIGGPTIDGPSLSRVLCDCALHRVLTSGRSAILEYGTSTRTIPAPLWSALVIRDEHCRFPGCDRAPTWCEGHHICRVTDNGPTELANLVLLCTRHHHRLHQTGWQAKLLPDAGFEVTQPDGIVRCSSPPRGDPGW